MGKRDMPTIRCGPNPLVLIYGTALISVMGVASILPVLPAMGKAFGLSPSSLGLLVISFTLPGIVLAPVGGVLADRLGRKAVLVPCLCLFALGGLAAALSDSLVTLLFWRVVQGCGAACLGVLYNTIIADIYRSDRERLRIMGFAATALSLGAAVYPALGGLLGEWGWRFPLLLSLSALPLAGIVLRTVIPPLDRRHGMQAYARNAVEIVKHPCTLGHFLITLCAFGILYGPMITYFPLLADSRFEASPSRIGSIFAMASVGTAAASCLLGRLARRYSSRTMVVAGSAFFGLSMLLMPLVGGGSNVWFCVLPVLLYGLGQGLVYPTVMSSLSTVAPPEGRGIIMAVNGTILRLAQTVSPPLCGVLFALGGFSGVYLLGTAIAATMLWTATRVFHRK